MKLHTVICNGVKLNDKEMVGDRNHSTFRWCDHSTNYQLQHRESITAEHHQRENQSERDVIPDHR